MLNVVMIYVFLNIPMLALFTESLIDLTTGTVLPSVRSCMLLKRDGTKSVKQWVTFVLLINGPDQC